MHGELDGGILTVRPKGRWSIFCVYLTIPAVNLKKHEINALLLSKCLLHTSPYFAYFGSDQRLYE